MLRKSTYLYSTVLLIFGLLYCFILSYPTQENIKQYYSYFNDKENLPLPNNKTTYTKTGVVKDILFQNDVYTRRYRIFCPNSLVYIDQTKNIFRICEELENARILLQEREGTKNSCRLFEAKRAFCNYHLNILSSPELYFSLFDSFFPTPAQICWQGVAEGANLVVKKNSSPILQTDFITFFTPENL